MDHTFGIFAIRQHRVLGKKITILTIFSKTKASKINKSVTSSMQSEAERWQKLRRVAVTDCDVVKCFKLPVYCPLLHKKNVTS